MSEVCVLKLVLIFLMVFLVATPGTAGSDVSPRVAESSTSQKINRVVPRAPSSQSPAMNSDTKSITPVKGKN